MVEVGETAVCTFCGQSEVHSQAMHDFSFELYPSLVITPGKAEYICKICTKGILSLGSQIYLKVSQSRGVHRLLLEKNLNWVFGIKFGSANEEPSAGPNPAGGKEA